MIDYKTEIKKIIADMPLASRWAEEAHDRAANSIESLCRRGVAEAWEEAAKACDEIAATRRTHPIMQANDLAENVAKECAAAIRTRKEQEGR